MKINIGAASYAAKWHDFEDGKLKIRPYPFSKSNLVFRDGALVIEGKDTYDVFEYCLVDWENYVDNEDKPLKLTKEVKKKVFDFRLGGIADFVLKTCRAFDIAKEETEKNSEAGLTGSSPKENQLVNSVDKPSETDSDQ